ncbi:unnamed protein product [Clonostachys solani]|uniref:Uncharacterized protein n=1 Tax=Clonostachys solani TaxID=160281 RepID=A0A9N9Z3E3_9HYPO|nr:unnamed protein product [Clonostachys solani]
MGDETETAHVTKTAMTKPPWSPTASEAESKAKTKTGLEPGQSNLSPMRSAPHHIVTISLVHASARISPTLKRSSPRSDAYTASADLAGTTELYSVQTDLQTASRDLSLPLTTRRSSTVPQCRA